jgi:hypothetical protein
LEKNLFLVAILCSDKHSQGVVPTQKKEWITPKISLMDASYTHGGKLDGSPEGGDGSDENGPRTLESS